MNRKQEERCLNGWSTANKTIIMLEEIIEERYSLLIALLEKETVKFRVVQFVSWWLQPNMCRGGSSLACLGTWGVGGDCCLSDTMTSMRSWASLVMFFSSSWTKFSTDTPLSIAASTSSEPSSRRSNISASSWLCLSHFSWFHMWVTNRVITGMVRLSPLWDVSPSWFVILKKKYVGFPHNKNKPFVVYKDTGTFFLLHDQNAILISWERKGDQLTWLFSWWSLVHFPSALS